MSTEKTPLEKQVSPLVQKFILGAVIAVILLIVVLRLIPVDDKGGYVEIKSKPKAKKEFTITGIEAAQKTSTFLKNLETQSQAFEIKTCNAEGKCAFEGKQTAPSYAWKILAYSALLNLSKEASYLSKISSIYDEMYKISDGTDLSWSAAQIFFAFKTTGEIAYTDRIYEAVRGFREVVESNFDPKKHAQESMLLAVGARQMALVYGMLGDKKIVEFLRNKRSISYKADLFEKDRTAFKEAGKKLLDLAIQSDSAHGNIVPGISEFREDGCWIALAKLEFARSAEEPKYYEELQELFKKLDFSERNYKQLLFSSASQVHPCIEVLLDLSEKNQDFKADAQALMEHFVLAVWDTPIHKICDGDFGYLASYRSHGSECANNIKANTDAAYAIYLLSRFNEQQLKVAVHE
ncbi:hypothetical protein JNK13_10720 [bacterium]|nr:hypothetical protein [bacterium]